MNRRFRRRRGGKRKFYPRSGASGVKGVMVNRTAARLHTAVAPHFLTKLEYGFSGHHTLVAGTNGFFEIEMNGLLEPGDNVNLFTAATAGGTVYPAAHALNALNPVGFSQLAVLYSSYRVLASKIIITYTPDTADMMLVVGPDTNNSATIGADTQRALAQPYHKAIQCTQTNNVKQNTISLYMDCPTTAGLTKQQYYDSDRVSALVNATPANLLNWNIYYASYAAATASAGSWQIRVIYWVDFFEPLPPTNV